jgi:hypothetical protein
VSEHKPLPDALCQRSDEGFILAANKRARSVLNKGLEKPRPSWRWIARVPDGVMHSPEYRALIVEPGPALCAMLCSLHNAGLQTLYWCDNCQGLHPVDDEQFKVLWMTAVSGAEGVMPAHETLQ